MSYNRTPQRSAAMSGGLSGEKREMQGLNDRLASFMAKVRALKQQKGATIDPASFLEALKMMEDEMNRCKGLYEAEIAKLRGQLNDLSQQKNDIAAQANKNTGMAQDLQSRLADEANKARSANDEVNCLKNALAQRDAEVATLRTAVQSKDKELQDLKPALARMAKDLDELKNRLARESAARQQAEDAIKQMQGKSGFDTQKKDQEIKDLKERLNATNNIIGTLQSKIKQLSQVDDANLDQLLAKIRDGTNAELARYQREMDEALNRSLGPLKRQLQEDGDAKKRLAAENEQLAKALRDLQARNAALEAEVNSLMKQKQALDGALNGDREKAAARIRELENKLQELQNLVMDKLKDNHAAQGAAASLRVEIDTYRTLLDGEENKLAAGNTPNKPMSGTNGYTMGGSSKIPQYTNTQPSMTRGKPPGPYSIYQTSYDRDLKSRGNSSLPGIHRSNTMQATYSHRC